MADDVRALVSGGVDVSPLNVGGSVPARNLCVGIGPLEFRVVALDRDTIRGTANNDTVAHGSSSHGAENSEDRNKRHVCKKGERLIERGEEDGGN